MGITKTTLYSTEQNELSVLLKALAHPARIAILQHLLKANACINSDLVEELGLAQATISQHLKELKSIGIIQGTVEGASMNYCINSSQWQTIQNLFNDFFNTYHTQQSNDCC